MKVFPFFALPEAIRKRYLTVGLHLGFPEVILYFHMGVIYRLNGVRVPFLPDGIEFAEDRPAGSSGRFICIPVIKNKLKIINNTRIDNHLQS